MVALGTIPRFSLLVFLMKSPFCLLVGISSCRGHLLGWDTLGGNNSWIFNPWFIQPAPEQDRITKHCPSRAVQCEIPRAARVVALHSSATTQTMEGSTQGVYFYFLFSVSNPASSLPSSSPAHCGDSIHPYTETSIAKMPQILWEPCPQVELKMRDAQMLQSLEKAEGFSSCQIN